MAQVERMRDSANPLAIPQGFTGIVAGYLRKHGDPFEPWTKANWQRFKGNKKLPIFVESFPHMDHVEEEAFGVLQNLYTQGVPVGSYTAIDLETAVNPSYVEAYGKILNYFGYKVFVYGSASTVFNNPPLNGYWVADYAGIGPFMFDHPNVRATQYADPAHGSGGEWDSSTVKYWTAKFGKWWK